MTVWLTVAYGRHMVAGILVNIGSGNGLLPDGTKPLPEPFLLIIRLYDFHIRAISQELLKTHILDTDLEMNSLILQPHTTQMTASLR